MFSLQPENILLDEDFRVKISDFGFAVKLKEEEKLRGTFISSDSDFVICSYGTLRMATIQAKQWVAGQGYSRSELSPRIF